jgi:hypothetical protein
VAGLGLTRDPAGRQAGPVEPYVARLQYELPRHQVIRLIHVSSSVVDLNSTVDLVE